MFLVFGELSGGAGEGRQHLSPTGEFPNHPEVKTDEELPSYCSPPNPCPLGFEGKQKRRSSSIDLWIIADDCDAAPMKTFTGEYSRMYQNGQDCQCDSDHDECLLNNIMVSIFFSISNHDVIPSLVTPVIFSTLLHLLVHRKVFSNEPDEFDA